MDLSRGPKLFQMGYDEYRDSTPSSRTSPQEAGDLLTSPTTEIATLRQDEQMLNGKQISSLKKGLATISETDEKQDSNSTNELRNLSDVQIQMYIEANSNPSTRTSSPSLF
jgi:hypothetical protein